MSEKERLLKQLFGQPTRREHIGVSFCRGAASDIAAEDLCRAAANGLEQVAIGLIGPISFASLDKLCCQRELSEIVNIKPLPCAIKGGRYSDVDASPS